jgi:hypothetical protein
MTTAILGCAIAGAPIGAVLAGIKLVWELLVLRHLRAPADDDLHKTAALLTGPLAMWFRARIALTLVGAALLLVAPLAALPLLVAGELVERRLFFTAVAAPRMPGMS